MYIIYYYYVYIIYNSYNRRVPATFPLAGHDLVKDNNIHMLYLVYIYNLQFVL